MKMYVSCNHFGLKISKYYSHKIPKFVLLLLTEAVKVAYPSQDKNLDVDIHGAIVDTLRAAGSKVNRRQKRAKELADGKINSPQTK